MGSEDAKTLDDLTHQLSMDQDNNSLWIEYVSYCKRHSLRPVLYEEHLFEKYGIIYYGEGADKDGEIVYKMNLKDRVKSYNIG